MTAISTPPELHLEDNNLPATEQEHTVLLDLVHEQLQSLPLLPGIYKMRDKKDKILYIGKAKHLKKRVSSYFQKQAQSIKTTRLVQKIARIETTVTHNETEALILEQQLIREHQPPYNILLRDDKSYPYLYLSKHPDFPYLIYKRVLKTDQKGYYFGPYPNSFAVRHSLRLLQKIFKIRSCNDTFFQHRSRPCLEYQIGRCSAPCVGKISAANYQEQVRLVSLFLQGKNTALLQQLAEKMEQAAARLAFEQAGTFRDQLIALQNVQNEQDISTQSDSSIDIFAAAQQHGVMAVGLLMIRQGKVKDFHSFFPRNTMKYSLQALLTELIAQYYLGEQHVPCTQIICNTALAPDARKILQAGLYQTFNRKVTVQHQVREQKAKWLHLAETNIQQQITSRLQRRTTMQQQLLKLQQWLGLEQIIQRMECFDISHSSGESAVASCVVFDQEGACKSAYRSYNMRDITPGDDYAAIYQAVYRRYKNNRNKKFSEQVDPQHLDANHPEKKHADQNTANNLPDIILIDGGKGQLTQALRALQDAEVHTTGRTIKVLAVAKGAERKPGLETFFITEFADKAGTSAKHPAEAQLDPHSAALHIMQQIRDEAHRFALSRHRKRRAKTRQHSQIEKIPGIGKKRARQLLHHFGSYTNLCRSNAQEMIKVEGISATIAHKVYQYLHGAGQD